MELEWVPASWAWFKRKLVPARPPQWDADIDKFREALPDDLKKRAEWLYSEYWKSGTSPLEAAKHFSQARAPEPQAFGQRHPRLAALMTWRSLAAVLLAFWAIGAVHSSLRGMSGGALVWQIVLLIVGVYGLDRARRQANDSLGRALAVACLIAAAVGIYAFFQLRSIRY